MKYKLFVFVILPLCVSCGRLANDMSASGVPAFNFTDKYNQMYEYDGYVKQVNTASEVNTVSYLSANNVLVSGKNNINVYTDEGAILFRYEPNEKNSNQWWHHPHFLCNKNKRYKKIQPINWVVGSISRKYIPITNPINCK